MPLISEAVKLRGRVSLISEVVIRGNCVSDFRDIELENECCVADLRGHGFDLSLILSLVSWLDTSGKFAQ